MKERMTRSFQEKYGIQSVKAEALSIIDNASRKEGYEDTYAKLPYLGKLYVEAGMRVLAMFSPHFVKGTKTLH
jgi:glutathione peroxidase-family protein